MGLQLLEMMRDLEEQFGIEIPDEDQEVVTTPGLLPQQTKLRRAVVVDKKHIPAVVTAPGNMMRTIRNHNASNPRHSGNPAPPPRGVNRK